MNYLAIDTCGKNLTVLISYNGKTDCYYDNECGVNHSVALMQKVEELVDKNGVDLKQMDFFAVVVGAGSFTGIRIGVATVKAMCFAFNKPCLSLTSFDTLAYNKQGGKVLSVIDAKHNSLYICGYTDKTISYPPAFVDKQVAIDLSSEYKLVSFEEIKGLDVEVVSLSEGLQNAIYEKSSAITSNLDSITPLYIRKSQAEEGR